MLATIAVDLARGQKATVNGSNHLGCKSAIGETSGPTAVQPTSETNVQLTSETNVQSTNETNEIHETNKTSETVDRSKFKKVEMSIFCGVDLDSWLFRADQYFHIHKLLESEKMTVALISFDGAVLDWYRAQEEQDPFVNWRNLKEHLLVRFRSERDGSLCGRFLAIKEESTVEEYQNLFDKLVAPLPQLSNQVLEETFMSGLSTDDEIGSTSRES